MSGSGIVAACYVFGIFAAFTSPSQRTASSRMNAPNCSGLPAMMVMPRLPNLAFSSAEFSASIGGLVEPADDRRGRARRRAKPVPGIGDELREALFGQRRHAGKQARALLGRDAENLDALVVEQRNDDGGRLEDRMHLVGEQVGHRRPAAPVQRHRKVRAGQLLEHKGEDVRRRAGGRREIELADIGPGIVGKLLGVLHRHVGIGNQEIGRVRHAGDRREALDRVVVELVRHRRQDRVRRRACDQDRIAVGVRRAPRRWRRSRRRRRSGSR